MTTSHTTDFGVAVVRDHGVTIHADQDDLYEWSHRPGHAWPCSQLDDLDSIAAHFDAHGLVDLTTEPACEDLAADELNAWSSDVLREVLPPEHPAYFVTVGQFD